MNDEVLSYFMKFKELGVVPDRILYNFAIKASCRLDLLKEANELIQEMKNNGLDPDMKHYTCLMGGLRDRGDSENAQLVFVEMVKLGLKPDTVTYNVLLSAFFSSGLIDKANILLGQMMVRGIDLNGKKNTYGLVIEGFYKGSRVSEAEGLFKMLQKSGLWCRMGQMGQTHLLSSMVWGYLCQGFSERACRSFLDYSEQGYLTDKPSRERLIRELCNEGKVVLASKVFHQIMKHGVVPDYISYGQLVAAFCRNRDTSDSIFWYKEMLIHGIPVDTVLYTILMDRCCKDGNLHDAFAFFRKARADRKLDVMTYSVLLDGCFKKFFETWWSETTRERIRCEIEDMVFELTQCMKKDGISPDVKCYTVLINGYRKLGSLNCARKWFDRMLRDGLQPDVRAYTVLIDGYARQGKKQKALELYKQMCDSGLSPDSFAQSVLDKRSGSC